jgi:6-pyruvoyl-tetrahydropterin synthase
VSLSVTVRATFSAAHHLRLPGGATEPVHGHNWHVALTVARGDGGVDPAGWVTDFHPLRDALDEVIGPWQNDDLNRHPPFNDGTNPTAELVAAAIASRVRLPEGVRVQRVEVSEAEGCTAAWTAG